MIDTNLEVPHNAAASRGPAVWIPHSRPYLGDDLDMVCRDIGLSGMIGPGLEVERFENEIAALHKAEGAVATSSGTAALHLALVALGIGKDDHVIIPSYVCTAVLNAVNYVDATPILVDVQENTFNIDPSDVAKKITPKTRAIIAPHLFGNPADIDALMGFGVPVIEDCAQSLGTLSNDRLAGSIADIAIFSFYATKVITTGEGGMVITKRPDLLYRMKDLHEYDERNDYKTRFNYRMSDLSAGTGRRQMLRLHEFICRRREIARTYSSRMYGTSLQLPAIMDGSIFYRYIVRSVGAEQHITALQQRGIQAKKPIFSPLHHYIGGVMPRTDLIHRTAISLPLYPAMIDAEVDYVVDTVNAVMNDPYCNAQTLQSQPIGVHQ